MRLKHPEQYMQACLSDKPEQAIATETVLEKAALPFEFMLNALRLKGGVPLSLYEERTFQSPDSLKEGLMLARSKGLMVDSPDTISLTPQGWLFLDEAVECFL